MAMALLLLLGAALSPEHEDKIPDLSKRINAFTLDLLKHAAAKTDGPTSMVLSPQSIFHGLAMSYVASGGETRKELADVLRFPNDNKALMRDLAALRRRMVSAPPQKRIDVSLANSAWLDDTYAKYRTNYVAQIQRAFAPSLHQVKFAQGNEVSQAINQWISENTRGRIQRGVGPEDFQSKSGPGVIDEPALVLVNAVYFKADWGSQFDKTATRSRPFQVDAATTRETLMMHQRSLLAYAENDRFKFLEIPYIGGFYSMYAVLPKELVSVQQLTDGVNAETVITLKRSAVTHRVDVLFPRFQMKTHLGVKDALQAMSVRSAFDNQKADFDKMIIQKFEEFRIYISQIYQDAWLEMHEEGTEAAAATTTTHYSFGCSAPPQPLPVQFHADRPFMFLIIHNPSRSILFAGWLADPAEL